jgi:Fe-Mn family superoxide dismutase
MKHELVKMEYRYDSLEPYLDAKTMEIHHSKHHQTYVDKLNSALEPYAGLQKLKLLELLQKLDIVPEAGRTAVKNHGGGVYNHNFFWTILKKDVKMAKEIGAAIDKKFGSFEKFKEQFTAAALNRFGSGWAWLVLNNGQLEILSTPNQDSPVSEGKIPLLTIDVWEHSYYLLYQWQRAKYVEAFFHIINWDTVNKYYKDALKGKTFQE